MKICILQPTYRFIPTESYQSMVNLMYYCYTHNIFFQFAISDHIKIDHVRNHLVQEYIKSGVDFDYILWIDSDSVFTPRHLEVLINKIVKNNIDIVSAKYYKRRSSPRELCVFEEIGDKFQSIIPNETGLQEVDGVGFGFMLMKPQVIKDMYNKYGARQFQFEYRNDDNEYISEDLNWCQKARELGYKIWLDNDCVIGHYGATI